MKVYTVGRAIVKPIARVLFRVRYMGHKQVDCQNPYILCSNHISDLDPVFIILAAPHKAKICFMAKAELFKIKILGWFIKKVGAFPVNRGKGDTGAIDHAEEIIRHGGRLGIFIEGTRSRTGEFLPPKSGAALIASKTHADILPVCLSAPKGKVRLFHKVAVHFGEKIPYERLGLSDNPTPTQLKSASRLIMDEIIKLKVPMEDK